MYFEIRHPRSVDEIKTSIADRSDDSQGEGMETDTPSIIIDIWITLKNLLGHTDVLTEASNLIEDSYERHEIQNDQQYQNAPDKHKS